MNGKQLKEFAASVPDDSVIEVEGSYSFNEGFKIRATLQVKYDTRSENRKEDEA